MYVTNKILNLEICMYVYIYIYIYIYIYMYVCTKSFLKTTTNSSCVCAHLANKADSDCTGPWCMVPTKPDYIGLVLSV